MRTIFTNQDMANLLTDVFKDNTIPVDLIDADTNERTESDMVSYLDIEFYTWWQHAKTSVEERIDTGANVLEAWRDSLNFSLGKSFALIEQTDEETIASQDIVGATVYMRTTFLIDASKVTNLEYYLRYLKGLYTGKPIKRETSSGENVVGYLTLGVLLYDTQPEMTQVGEMIQATINWRFAYMGVAGTYSDVNITLSLDGTNYYEMPLTKYTWQQMFTKQAVPTSKRVDKTGFIVQSISQQVTLAFFDFHNQLNTDLSKIFWRLSADIVNERFGSAIEKDKYSPSISALPAYHSIYSKDFVTPQTFYINSQNLMRVKFDMKIVETDVNTTSKIRIDLYYKHSGIANVLLSRKEITDLVVKTNETISIDTNMLFDQLTQNLILDIDDNDSIRMTISLYQNGDIPSSIKFDSVSILYFTYAPEAQKVNIPIFVKCKTDDSEYTYKCVLTDMQKVFQNNDFTISSITLNGWGKAGV